MRYATYVDLGKDDSCLAWIVELPVPGCHARGYGREAVLAALPGEINAYLDTVARHRPGFDPAPLRPSRIEVAGEYRRRRDVTSCSAGLFPPEECPLAREEIGERLALLRATRGELLSLTRPLEPAALDWPEPGRDPAFHTVRAQLRHVAGVERWYMSRLWPGLPRLEPSRTVWDRLDRTRSLVEEWLGNLPETELGRAGTSLGERWNVTKVMRRLAYHEWFHLRVIQRILRAYREHARTGTAVGG